MIESMAVRADDVFLSLIGSGVWSPGTMLTRVLAAWRRDVDSEPFSIVRDGAE